MKMDIANMFKIDLSTVYNIKNYKTYKYIQPLNISVDNAWQLIKEKQTII